MPVFVAGLVVVISLDQALKALARGRRSGGGRGFVYRENPDGALGGVSPAVSSAVLLSAAVFVIALLVLSDWPALMAAGLGAAMGGAASNFFDQARNGFVIDYLDVSVGHAINLGDVAITAGLALGVLGLFL